MVRGANPAVDPGGELILVLLEEGDEQARRTRVSRLLERLGARIEVEFRRGWIATATTDAKSLISAHRDVKVAGGVHRRSDRTLPRRIRRLAHE